MLFSFRPLKLRAVLSMVGLFGLTWLAVACDSASVPLLENSDPVTDTERNRWRDRAARVEIVRDDWGVPHINAPTDADAIFGLMYAQAEDDFPRIERNYLLSLGRLAEAEGADALWLDLRMKLFIDPEALQRTFAESPPFLQALMQGWADGLNYYLATHPRVRPRVIERFEPWMALSFSEGSIGGDIERIDLGALEAFYGSGANEEIGTRVPAYGGIRPVASAAEAHALPGEPVGSNGIALAPQRSATGAAMLLINPHTSFYFRHEAHITSAEGLNAYGALTWGQFFVYQGFNETAGWMHTSSSVDNIDEFVEDIVEREEGLFYRYGDELRPVTVRSIDVPYLEDRILKTRTFTTYRTHHGPIVRSEAGRWVAVALMEEPMKALIQSYTRTKAADLDAYLAIMEAHTNSSNNTLFADAKGNIAYLHSNFVPIRSNEFDYRRPVDGSNPETDWQGIHSIEESPNAINPPTGWAQNTNNWPYSAAGPASPQRTDYPAYMDSGTENARGRHAVDLLSAMDRVSLDEFVELAFSSRVPAFERLLPPLLDAWRAARGQDETRVLLAPAMQLLIDWDRRWATDSVATSIAVFYGTALLEQARAELGANPEFRNVMAYMAESMEPADYLAALGSAIGRLQKDFGTWRKPWGQINRFQRLNGAVDLAYDDAEPSVAVGFTSGRWGSLASFGARPRAGTKRWYGSGGNSFVAVVSFGDRLQARAVTAGGLSNDPESPHFDDQVFRYAEGNLRPVYFYPDELVGHVERRYRPGE